MTSDTPDLHKPDPCDAFVWDDWYALVGHPCTRKASGVVRRHGVEHHLCGQHGVCFSKNPKGWSYVWKWES